VKEKREYARQRESERERERESEIEDNGAENMRKGKVTTCIMYARIRKASDT
jgi:hypothetical protein